MPVSSPERRGAPGPTSAPLPATANPARGGDVCGRSCSDARTVFNGEAEAASPPARSWPGSPDSPSAACNTASVRSGWSADQVHQAVEMRAQLQMRAS